MRPVCDNQRTLIMEKLLVVSFSAMLLISCDLWDDVFDDDNPCEIVEEESVPQVVMDSLSMRYPEAVPINWYNKDNNGYCVNFKLNEMDVMALFDNSGKFLEIGEEIEGGDCECEIDDD
jgi:hypothetical protein